MDAHQARQAAALEGRYVELMEFHHTPVMVPEVIELLNVCEGGTYIDGTAGLGGHTDAILQAAADVNVLGIDRDQTALQLASERLRPFGERVRLMHGSFPDMAAFARELGWSAVDGVLLDLGVSSMQLDDAKRGFSFRFDAPLDMRMNTRSKLTAAVLLNERTEAELTAIFRDLGEERWARKVARAVVERRQRSRWSRTGEFAELVERIVGRSRDQLPPATRCFMALRIAVNDELEELRRGLRAGVDLLGTGGRIVVISFHSLEDRIVKHFFRAEAATCVCPPELPVCCCDKVATLEILTRKPLRPRQAETMSNRRSAPAKLRAARKLSLDQTEHRKTPGA